MNNFAQNHSALFTIIVLYLAMQVGCWIGMWWSSRGNKGYWLVADGGINPQYRRMDEMGIHWTPDEDDALRFSRREDAECFACGDEDAWRIIWRRA